MAGLFEPAVDPNWGDDLAGPNDDLTRPSDASIKAGWAHGVGGPPRGYFNWLLKQVHNGINYFMARGLPLWSSARTYVAGSVVRASDGQMYVAIAPTVGSPPTVADGKWRLGTDLTSIGPWGNSGNNYIGDAVTNTTVDYAGDVSFRNLTLGGSALVRVTNGVVRVGGTLTIAAGGVLRAGIQASLAGGNGTVGGAGGIGGVGGNNSANGSLFAGSNGGVGGLDGPITGGSAGDALQDWYGGNGGNGGNGTGGGAGGAGFAVTNAYNPAKQSDLFALAMNSGFGFTRGGSATARVPTPFGIQGGAGGGGGGGGTLGAGTGGGGGAGGGVLLVLARRIVIAADGAFQAPGGVGGNPGGNAAPGGGGGGGAVILLFGSKGGPALTQAVCAPGGAHGTGGTGTATNGSTGNVAELQIY